MNQEPEEELSKKSYEVILPLDKNFNLSEQKGSSEYNSSDVESDEDDKDGRPSCNTWNGKNHGLYVLGHNDNPFLKHLKSFQVPETVQVEFDPFSRADCNLKGEHPITDAFLVWSAKERDNKTSPPGSKSEETVNYRKSEVLEISLSDSEDELNEKETCRPLGNEDSDTEVEMFQFIKSLKEKKSSGLNRTGETLWYDNEHEVIRNLHSKSISITNYGDLKHQSQFGKQELLFNDLTIEEKQMLVNNNDKDT